MNGKNLCSTTCLIPLALFFRSEDEEIQRIIEKLGTAIDFPTQQECIKSFAIYIEESFDGDRRKELVLKILTFLYISCVSKNPIKKTIARTLAPVKDINVLMKNFSDSLKIQLNFIQEDADLSKKYRRYDYYIAAMYGSLEFTLASVAIIYNFEAVINFSFTFLSDMIDYLWNKKQVELVVLVPMQLYAYIYNNIRFLLSILQKCEIHKMVMDQRLTLMGWCYDIISHKNIPYETKNNSGHIIAILLTGLPAEYMNESMFKTAPYLELLKFVKNQPSPMLDKIGFNNIADPVILETFKVCVYIGILIVAPRPVLWTYKIDNEFILTSMFKDLIQSAKTSKGEPVQILGITKAISMISTNLGILPFQDIMDLFQESLEYVIIYIDDKIDVVRNYTKNVFVNFLHIAWNGEKTEEKTKLLQMILKWIKGLPICSARYTVLSAICSQTGCELLLKNIPYLPKQLFHEITTASTTDDVSSCYINLMRQNSTEETSDDEWIKRWVDDIAQALKTFEPPLAIVFRKLFLLAFSIRPIALRALLRQRYLNTENEVCAYLLCLHSARKLGLQIPLQEFYQYPMEEKYFWRGLIEYDTLEILQTHQSEEVRILVLETIIDCQRTTEKYLDWEINFLQSFFAYNINTSNSSVRQQLVALAKKAITRMQYNVTVIEKSTNYTVTQSVISSVMNVENSNNPLGIYLEFWENMFKRVLLPGLNPDSNYGRKSTCLELLHYIYSNIPQTTFFSFWDKADLSNLKCILQYDTYERNKELASQILSVFTAEQLGCNTRELLKKYIEDCYTLALSIKPMQTISAAYMLKACLISPHIFDVSLNFHTKIDAQKLKEIINSKDSLYVLLSSLMYELENCCVVGEQNLQEASASKPIHGFVFCIRHLLKNEVFSLKSRTVLWKFLIRDLLNICFRLSELVKTIICNESPEGYLPADADLDISGSDETAKAQMITVYGWRATKEISLLFGELALKAPLYDESCSGIPGIMDEAQMRLIGKYFFDLLTQSKHRGAFEQASVGFYQLCYRLWRIHNNNNLGSLPLKWLEKIMNTMVGVGDEALEACATRRSAGVPFLVQAVVITKPNLNSDELYQLCMKTLLEVGGDISKPDEQRIHCLNILRALYRHNHLSDLVVPYCAAGIIIAVDGFGSGVWGIRNSSTLLFSSLMVRIFGVPRIRDSEIISDKNKMMAQVFFVRYPELYKFLLDQLKNAVGQSTYPSLFPVLLILSRLYRGLEGSSSYKLDPYLTYIKSCMANPVYKIRDLAAKTVVNWLCHKEIPQYIIQCFVALSSPTLPNNYCHGILVQLQYLLKTFLGKINLNLAKIIDSTAWIIICSNRNISHLTATLYLEIIIHLLVRLDSNFQNCKTFTNLSKILSWHEKDQTQHKAQVSTAFKNFNVNMLNIRIFSLLHLLKHRHADAGVYLICMHQTIITNAITDHSELRSLCVSYFKHLNPTHIKHNLLEEDDSEYSDLVQRILKTLNIPSKLYLHEILYSVLAEMQLDNHSRSTEVFLMRTFGLRPFPPDTITKQHLLTHVVYFCFNCDEQIVSLAIAYLNDFLVTLAHEELNSPSFDTVVTVIIKYCLPSVDVSHRFAITKLLVRNQRIFYTKETAILSRNNLCLIWEAVFMLLQDDNETVRNSICQLCQKDVAIDQQQFSFVPQIRVDIPEYSRKILLNSMVAVLPSQCSVDILLSWIFRGVLIISGNVSEVFDVGESNSYAELYPMALEATAILDNILWTLEDGCNFKDQSIFIEEQSLLIATTLFDKFRRNGVPFITDKMNLALRHILGNLGIFLEKVVINQPDFKELLTEVICDCLRNDVVTALNVSELIRLKMFVAKIFKIHLQD